MISTTWRFPPKNRDIDVIVPGPGTRKCLKLHVGPAYASKEHIMARSSKTTKTAPDATTAERKAAGRRFRKASKVSTRDY